MAIGILEDNPDEICWEAISANSAAMELLKANQNKIDWAYLLSENPAISEYDYERMKSFKKDLNESIVAAALNPDRLMKRITSLIGNHIDFATALQIVVDEEFY